MKTRGSQVFIAMAAAVILSACGTSGGNEESAAPVQHSAAVVRLLSTGVSSTICGVDVTVNLAAGVSMKSPAASGETAAGVVVASGAASSGSIVSATYTAPTISQQGRLRIMLVNARGFGTGEFCTINGDIAAGSFPNAADFGIAGFAASDENGNIITGLTPSYALELR